MCFPSAAQAAQEALEQAEKDRLKAIEDAAAAEKAAAEAALHQDDSEFLKLSQQPEEDTTPVPADQQLEAGPAVGNTETSAHHSSAMQIPAASSPLTSPLSSHPSACVRLHRPAAASPDVAPAENFPYPAEYAYKPDDTASPPPSPPPPAAPELVQQEIESFPYPAEYAYRADDGSHAQAADGGLVVEEEEEVAPPLMAGVVLPPAQATPEAAAAPVEAAPAAAASATFTLEGEKLRTSTLPWRERGWWGRWGAPLPAWVDGVWEGVEQSLSPVHPVLWEMLDFYAQCWAYVKHKLHSLIPTPLTHAQGERAKEDSRNPYRQNQRETRGGGGTHRAPSPHTAASPVSH